MLFSDHCKLVISVSLCKKNKTDKNKTDNRKLNERWADYEKHSKNSSNAFRAFFIATAIGYSTIAATVENIEFNRWNGLTILLVSGILDFAQFFSVALITIRNVMKVKSGQDVSTRFTWVKATLIILFVVKLLVFLLAAIFIWINIYQGLES